VTIARALSETFAGIAPSDAPGFIVAQLIGAVAAASPQSNHPAPEHQGVLSMPRYAPHVRATKISRKCTRLRNVRFGH